MRVKIKNKDKNASKQNNKNASEQNEKGVTDKLSIKCDT